MQLAYHVNKRVVLRVIIKPTILNLYYFFVVFLYIKNVSCLYISLYKAIQKEGYALVI